MSDGMTDGARDRRVALAEDDDARLFDRVKRRIELDIGNVPVDQDVMWAKDARWFATIIVKVVLDELKPKAPQDLEWRARAFAAVVRSNERLAADLAELEASCAGDERMIADLAEALAREHESVVKHANLKPCATCELLGRALDRNRED